MEVTTFVLRMALVVVILAFALSGAVRSIHHFHRARDRTPLRSVVDRVERDMEWVDCLGIALTVVALVLMAAAIGINAFAQLT